MKKHIFIVYFFILVLGILPTTLLAKSFEVQDISVLKINSAITPATLDYLSSKLKLIPSHSLILIKINTPGGLVSTTKEIITLMGQDQRPFVLWITPEGASAASAGAIIASAAHFIFMSPGTHIGAATPVGLGSDLTESDGKNKALNDLMALTRALSESRARPAKPFEEMIKIAKSFTDKEALAEKIIDGVISTEKELISSLEGKSFVLQGQAHELHFNTDLAIKEYGPTVGQSILDVLANPTTAYFLFLIGVTLIYFEFQAPGGYIAGALGFCFVILAGIAFQVLPLNWGAFALMILGLGLFILEVFLTSYGLLSLAGLASFILGSLFVFHDESGYISVEHSLILSALLGVVLVMGVIIWYLVKRSKTLAHTNFFLPIDELGIVMNLHTSGTYQIKVRGEIWNAQSDDELIIGDQIKVIKIDKELLMAHVKKFSHS